MHDHYRMIHDIYVLLDDGDRRVLRSFDLNTSQYAVLLLLMDSEQGRRLTDVSARLLFDKSTITRIVDRLELANLVCRVADPNDRRAQRVILTPQGREICRRTRELHEHSLEQRFTMLNTDEQQQLNRLLSKLRISLRSHLGYHHTSGCDSPCHTDHASPYDGQPSHDRETSPT